jgi:hypothetical protein
MIYYIPLLGFCDVDDGTPDPIKSGYFLVISSRAGQEADHVLSMGLEPVLSRPSVHGKIVVFLFLIIYIRNELFASFAATVKQIVNGTKLFPCTVLLTNILTFTYFHKNYYYQ